MQQREAAQRQPQVARQFTLNPKRGSSRAEILSAMANEGGCESVENSAFEDSKPIAGMASKQDCAEPRGFCQVCWLPSAVTVSMWGPCVISGGANVRLGNNVSFNGIRIWGAGGRRGHRRQPSLCTRVQGIHRQAQLRCRHPHPV